jgi:hypothetical protein
MRAQSGTDGVPGSIRVFGSLDYPGHNTFLNGLGFGPFNKENIAKMTIFNLRFIIYL